MPMIQSLFEHTTVELQPAQLTVDEQMLLITQIASEPILRSAWRAFHFGDGGGQGFSDSYDSDSWTPCQSKVASDDAFLRVDIQTSCSCLIHQISFPGYYLFAIPVACQPQAVRHNILHVRCKT